MKKYCFLQTRNPEDVKLHIRLLKLYIHSREVNKAFEHAVKTEKKHTFVSCMDWYECLFDIYQVHVSLCVRTFFFFLPRKEVNNMSCCCDVTEILLKAA